MNHAKLWPNSLYVRQLVLLIFVSYRLSGNAPCISSLLKPGIVKLAAKVKRLLKAGLPGAAWIDSIFISFHFLAQSCCASSAKNPLGETTLAFLKIASRMII